MAIEIGVVAVVAVLASAVRGPVGAGTAAGLGVVALVPLALTGHSSGAADHELVVSSWWLHLAGVCAWAGGLVALAWLGRRGGLGRQVGDVARRYSVVAGWGFALVAASGAANAWARVGGLDGLPAGTGCCCCSRSACSWRSARPAGGTGGGCSTGSTATRPVSGGWSAPRSC